MENVQKKPYVTHLADAYAMKWSGCPCVFVLSTGRTGTKTLANLLSLSPDIAAFHEPVPKLVKASFDAFMQADKSLAEHWGSLVMYARDDYIFNANLHGKLYIETNNRLTYLASALARAFPDSRFIHLHRNPFEVIYSALRRQWYENHPWDFARIMPRQGDPFAESWNTMTALEKNAWYWAKVNELIIAFFQSLPDWRKFTLPSELLFKTDKQTIDALFEFIGAQIPQAMQIQQVISTKLNAQGGAPSLKTWTEQERETVKRITQKIAFQLGYEL
ncbi:MAG TPA: sulfotransferase [Thermodesulfovibrionia bacterium]|nr:sulfotransferase [Thermodesulfovibrionia bacterium]